MMKKYQSSLITSFMILMLTSMIMSCSKKSTSSSATNPVGTTDSSTTNGGGTSGDNTNTSGITCAGDNSDGFDDNPNDYQSYPLRIYQIALGGQKSWIPGNPAHRPEDKSFLKTTDQSACEPLACNPSEMTDRTKRSNRCYYCFRTGTSSNPTYVNTPFSDPIPLMKDVWSHSNNDGDIFFRLKIKSPKEFNLNGYGGAYCYGRVANDNGTYVPYTTAYSKIKLDIYARVLRKTTNCDINSNCTEADFTLMSTRYLIKSGIELDVNKCSTVIRLPFANLASTNADAVVLEFANVKTNVSCSAGSGTFCALNTANCWFATLQIATNETFFFKGYTRSAIPYN